MVLPFLYRRTCIHRRNPFFPAPSKKRWLRIVNIFAISALFSLQEILLILSGNLAYTNWHFTSSLFINVCVMIVLSWFSIVVLDKKEDVAR